MAVFGPFVVRQPQALLSDSAIVAGRVVCLVEFFDLCVAYVLWTRIRFCVVAAERMSWTTLRYVSYGEYREWRGRRVLGRAWLSFRDRQNCSPVGT